MIHIPLRIFILAFSLIFCGCPIGKIVVNNNIIEQAKEMCQSLGWLFMSYEERIEYSLSPLLDNIKEDLEEYQELREKIFRFVEEELNLPRKEAIGEKEIEKFLEKFFDPNIKEEGAYIFAKEQVKETLNKLNSYYLEKGIGFQIGRKKLQEDETAEQYINHIVFSIYIAKDTIGKKNEKLKEFVSELNKLYKSEHGEVGGFVKLQQRKGDGNYNNSVYNIDKLYGIFENFYKEGNVCVNSQGSIEGKEDYANAVVEFYKGEKAVDKGKQIEMFEKEICQICKDIPRTYPHFGKYFKAKEKYAEFIKILSKMLFFAVFCIRLINEKEAFPFLSVDDIRKELSGMQGLDEKKIQDMHKLMKDQSTSFVAYSQGLNEFAGFFVTLYFIVNQKFGGNVNNEEIIDGEKEIIDKSKIIKLFVFYLLHKWDCDSSVNYLPSCSLYDTHVLIDLFFFIFLRRFNLLHMYTDYVFNYNLLNFIFAPHFFTYRLSKIKNCNDCLDYIMYLDLHLYIVKKKDINFYFDWFNFLFYKILHCIEKKDMKYYGYGPYTEIVKVLFSHGQNFMSADLIQSIFSTEENDDSFKNFRKKNICTIF